MFALHPVVLAVGYTTALVAPVIWVAVERGAVGLGAGFLVVATGLVALAGLLLQFVSSGRFETLSGRIGIDRTMRFHQLAAIAIVLLALVHPLPMVWPRSPGELAQLPAQLAMLLSAPYLLSGVLALGVLAVLVVMGVLRRRLPMRYEFWRAAHALMAITVAVAATHHALAVGMHSSQEPMRTLWLLLLALALGTLATVYLVKPAIMKRRAYRVRSNTIVAPRVREIVLEPQGRHRVRHRAGQFAWVLFDQPAIPLLDHPFSISSTPEAVDEIRFLVKERGDFTSGLANLHPGARALLDAPHGNFTLEAHPGGAVVLLAGGIGIAPVIALLRHLVASCDRRPIALVHAVRSADDLVHLDEIRAATDVLDLRVHLVLEEMPEGNHVAGLRWATLHAGRVDADLLRTALRGAPVDCVCFLCGPPAMLEGARAALRAAGVPRAGIVFERFEYR